MQTTHYFWNYLPLLLQILVAVGMGTVMVTGSSFIGKHRRTIAKLDTYECGIVAEGNAPRPVFRPLLYGCDALHTVRCRSRFHAALGGDLPHLQRITGSRYFGFWEMLCISAL